MKLNPNWQELDRQEARKQKESEQRQSELPHQLAQQRRKANTEKATGWTKKEKSCGRRNHTGQSRQ